jgi:ribosomal protein S18 acetylase RimI-like enzyme
MDVTIRSSRPEDAEGIHHCLDVVARERRHIAMVEGPGVEQVRAFIASFPERSVIQHVAVDGERVVGWCDVTPRPWQGYRHGAALGMGLLPEYRSLGLGTELLRSVLREAAARELSRIELEVYPTNHPAIRLYERVGFVHEGRKRAARVLDGQAEDVLCMALLLPPLGAGAR